jgi:hypothetical protein
MEHPQMTEKQLKLLFQYGFITKHEQEVLFGKIRQEGLTPNIKKDILRVLEDTIEKLDDEEERILEKKEHIEEKIRAIDEELKKEVNQKFDRLLAERKEEIWHRKKKKAQAVREIFYEIERLDRKMDELNQEIKKKLEDKRLFEIRKKLM